MTESNMNELRQQALASIQSYFDLGRFREDLAQLVAAPTSSNDSVLGEDLRAYLEGCVQAHLRNCGMEVRIYDNPDGAPAPFLLAERKESEELPTLLLYGHGDTVPLMRGSWNNDRDPLKLDVESGELERWYGRGIADSKGQHMITIAALAQVIKQRGDLGFNCVFLLEMGEELGSPGLENFCRTHPQIQAADLFMACDGPRQSLAAPDIQTGARGAMGFRLRVEYRDQAHHSGNWGGALANPGTVLMHALTQLVGSKGEIAIEGLRAPAIDQALREAMRNVSSPSGPGLPEVQEWWGPVGLSTAEKLFCSNTFEVLSFVTGNPQQPVGAVPPWAEAHCQIRFVSGSDEEGFLGSIRKALDESGFEDVQVERLANGYLPASRMRGDHPAIAWAKSSIERTLNQSPNVLPNFAGSVPNALFHEAMGLPTLWLPHSYLGCCQHAPNEHVLAPLMRQGLEIMTGLFWDLGEGFPLTEKANTADDSGMEAND